MKPVLRWSSLGKRVYLVTRYTDHGSYITAHTKYDVTDEFNRVVAERALDAFGEAIPQRDQHLIPPQRDANLSSSPVPPPGGTEMND